MRNRVKLTIDEKLRIKMFFQSKMDEIDHDTKLLILSMEENSELMGQVMKSKIRELHRRVRRDALRETSKKFDISMIITKNTIKENMDELIEKYNLFRKIKKGVR